MPAAPEKSFGPWNPGLNSTIPGRLMPRITLFDPAHSFVDWDEANALAEATGLDTQELAITRPERLAFHSVLIRVTSQLYVPDGPNYADLGISLRAMAAEINDGFVVPNMEAVRAAYNAVAGEAEETVAQLLDAEIYGETEVEPEGRGLMARIFTKPPPVKPPPDPTERALIIANAWRDSRNEDMGAASRRAIARVLSAILNHRGALYVERETIAKVAVGLVLNRLGSAAVGRIVQHQFAAGVEALGYRWLPSQESPVVLNAKGASASGKSTIRSAQRGIAEHAGYDWRDFAIISPDYWRKALIDYDGLGSDFKYAAMLSGYELEVIDRKLDLLMADKGSEGDVPHMLIDRFRFDSFQSDGVRAEDSTLLTRFGAKVYLFFLVTPPAATVERAWSRGLGTGRYKAVDDLLYHNVEAYSGMPDLFFRWAKGRGKWVQYEFLDNSVAQGELPRTIAYGQNGNLIVVDLERLCDIDRFREVHVDARCSDGVKLRTLSGFEASTFFRRAVKELPRVDVLVPGGNEIYASSENGRISVDMALLPPGIEPEAFGDFVETSGGLGRLESHGEQELVGNC